MRKINPIFDYAAGAVFLAGSYQCFFNFGALPYPRAIYIVALVLTFAHFVYRYPETIASHKNKTITGLLLLLPTLIPVVPGATRNALAVAVGLNGVIALASAASSGNGAFANVFVNWRDRLMSSLDEKAFLAAIFVATAALYATGTFLVFDGIPHVQDEIAQLFNARIWASGRLFADVPVMREFFDFPNMIMREGWLSQYPPGHIFLLTIGVLLHAPWVVNPLLAATTVIVVYLIGKEIADERTGRASALLLFASPFFGFLGASFMNHVATALAASIFVLFYIRADKSGRLVHGLIAGEAIGFAALIRPLTAFALCAPFAIHSIATMIKAKKLDMSKIAVATGALPMIALLFAYNRAAYGSFAFGYSVLHGPIHGLGFGVRGLKGLPTVEHTFALGMSNMLDDLAALSKFLFEWPAPSLLLAVCALLAARGGKYKYLMAASFASLAVAYVFFFFHRMILGPRFLSEAAPMLCVLTALGIAAASSFLDDISKDKSYGAKFVATAIGVCAIWAVAVNVPSLVKAYSSGFWMVTSRLNDTVESNVPEGKKALVFVEGDENYGSGFAYNTPNLDGRIIYARDLGAKNGLLAAKYPDRMYFKARLDLGKGLVGIREMPAGSF